MLNEAPIELAKPIPPETVRVEKFGDEPRVDSRQLAGPLGVAHRSLFRLLTAHEADFGDLGVMRFEIAKPRSGSKGGRPESFAMLNEDQAYLLLTYAKNTPEARRLKKHLVVTFRRARDAIDGRITIDRSSFEHALHVERDAAAAKERGRIGGHLLGKWRREKPVYSSALNALQVELQLVLPWNEKE